MKDNRQNTGKKGEEQACLYLKSEGHRIIARNWMHSHKEIDIISIKDNVLHIVEVKSKTAPLSASPVLNVNRTKQRNLEIATKAFLNSAARNNLPQDLEVVFDVISIVFYEDKTTIEYYSQAYIPTYV